MVVEFPENQFSRFSCGFPVTEWHLAFNSRDIRLMDIDLFFAADDVVTPALSASDDFHPIKMPSFSAG